MGCATTLKGHQLDCNLGDFCDGKVYHSHPLFTLHSTALQLFFYYDDLEVCNPLGSKRKIHKVGEFTSLHYQWRYNNGGGGVGLFIKINMGAPSTLIFTTLVDTLHSGMFYYMLGNISPKFRSMLSSINLVAIAKHRDLTKYGIDSVIQPFIEDVKKLVSHYYFDCDFSCTRYLPRKMDTVL